VITVAIDGQSAEDLELAAIDAGAVDVTSDDGQLEIYTEPGDLEAVRAALEAQQAQIVNAERTLVPTTTVALDSKHAAQMLRLVDRLEELDDVQKVYSNVDIADEDVEAYAG
jgi:transcriptional/translational regulatory protein YebC/TACO1